MFNIDPNIAIELPGSVLYRCDCAGVSGLVDADNFESNPIDAAKLVVCYIHAHCLQISENQYDEFLHKYELIFEYSEENEAADYVDEYVVEIKEIVEKYI